MSPPGADSARAAAKPRSATRPRPLSRDGWNPFPAIRSATAVSSYRGIIYGPNHQKDLQMASNIVDGPKVSKLDPDHQRKAHESGEPIVVSRSSRPALGNAVSAIEYRPRDRPDERYRVQHADGTEARLPTFDTALHFARKKIMPMGTREPELTKAMTLRLPNDRAADLEALARVERKPVSEVVREAIDLLVEARRKDKAFQEGVRRMIEEDRAILERLT
jgi:predicted transcriptional regulator